MNTLPYYSCFLCLAARGLAISPGRQVAVPSNASNHTSAPHAEAWPWTSAAPGPLGLWGSAEDGRPPQTREAGQGGEGHQHWALGQWMASAAAGVLVLALAHTVLCCTLGPTREEGPASSPRKRKAEATPRLLSPYAPWSPNDAPAGSSLSLASSGLLSRSASMARASESSLLRGACAANTLCPQLVVPENCTLQCALPRIVCHRRQNLIVSINSLAVPGETALFQARLAEGGPADFSGLGIHLEMLGGEEEFAFLSTQEVWASQGARNPEMDIKKVSGAKYATIRKNDPATYIMARESVTLMVFSGRFSVHDVQVCTAMGQTVARVTPGSIDGMYEVVVYTNIDAGLVILGLLAIDKIEIAPA